MHRTDKSRLFMARKKEVSSASLRSKAVAEVEKMFAGGRNGGGGETPDNDRTAHQHVLNTSTERTTKAVFHQFSLGTRVQHHPHVSHQTHIEGGIYKTHNTLLYVPRPCPVVRYWAE